MPLCSPIGSQEATWNRSYHREAVRSGSTHAVFVASSLRCVVTFHLLLLTALIHRVHHVAAVDAGVTDAVLKETARALERHELIKVRLPAVERAARAEMTRKLCEGTEAEAVQEIGRVAALYRRAQKPRLIFPE